MKTPRKKAEILRPMFLITNNFSLRQRSRATRRRLSKTRGNSHRARFINALFPQHGTVKNENVSISEDGSVAVAAGRERTMVVPRPPGGPAMFLALGKALRREGDDN